MRPFGQDTPACEALPVVGNARGGLRVCRGTDDPGNASTSRTGRSPPPSSVCAGKMKTWSTPASSRARSSRSRQCSGGPNSPNASHTRAAVASESDAGSWSSASVDPGVAEPVEVGGARVGEEALAGREPALGPAPRHPPRRSASAHRHDEDRRKAVERSAAAPRPVLQVPARRADRLGMETDHEHGAVGDLARQLDHPRARGEQVHRRRRSARVENRLVRPSNSAGSPARSAAARARPRA